MHASYRIAPPEAALRGLYLTGGWAALLAALLFRRNLGMEISLFSPHAIPETAAGWLRVLDEAPLVGLAYLNLFDVVNFLLLGAAFLALYYALRPARRSMVTLAAALGLAAIVISAAANPSLAMLSLSRQYAAACCELGPSTQAAALAAAQALTAASGLSGTIAASTPGFTSFLAMALAHLLFALASLRSPLFPRASAYAGIAAAGLDLIYCLAAVVLPPAAVPGVGLATVPLAGLLLMVWHAWIGIRLIAFGRAARALPGPAPAGA